MKMKRFFLVLLAMLLVLSIFTACDDDDDNSADYNEESEESEESRACTEEDYEIIVAIIDAVDDAFQDDDNLTASYSDSGYTGTFTLKTHTCTVGSYYDNSDISVTIKSGSTVETTWYSSSASVRTYNVDATVDGTSWSLYIKAHYSSETFIIIFLKVELDGVVLTGIEGTSLARSVAAEAIAE